MAWNPASGRFPLTGTSISMSQLLTGFNLQGGTAITYPFALTSLIGKTLYNADGSTYAVPGGTLSLSYFYGRYFLNTAPFSQSITANATGLTPPANRPTPTGIIVTMEGGGGGGGDGGTARQFDERIRGGGGGGGGGGGAQLITPLVSWPSITSISFIVPAGGSGGSDGDGGDGTPAQTTINGTAYIANQGGKGLVGANGILDNPPAAGGAGGAGGSGGTNTGADGNVGGIGSTETTNGGAGGSGGNGGSGNSSGGAGGNGANDGSGRPSGGQPGGNGFITVTWYFT
jgi:hypothetical protein